MKSQLYIKWILAIFVISTVTVIIVLSLQDRIVKVLVEFAAGVSAEMVATQLSAFLTVSSAAPNSIRINYEILGDALYDVKGENRRLIVKPKYGRGEMLDLEIDRLYAIDLSFEFKDVNSFVITKDGSVYNIMAYRR